jgi:NADH-Ubiquinone/plastoquinone (complex I), various chains.
MKPLLKYFLFGALSSAIIVYGISLAYGLTGSTNIGEVIQGLRYT